MGRVLQMQQLRFVTHYATFGLFGKKCCFPDSWNSGVFGDFDLFLGLNRQKGIYRLYRPIQPIYLGPGASRTPKLGGTLFLGCLKSGSFL